MPESDTSTPEAPAAPSAFAGDFWTFQKMITPVIVRWVFAAGVLIIPIGTAMKSCEGVRGGDILGCAFAGLLCSVLLLPVWRIVCELAIVLFNINDRLGEIKTELKKQGP